MATQPNQKITLAFSRDIPFNKLVLSQSNVRRVKAGVSIEELAQDIAQRGLLQGLCVRAVVNDDGVETGLFEIPAGGRRYRALELLVKQKRLAKTQPVPCIVRQSGVAEEDSLAENLQRQPLHPLDQFRAFLALKEKGQSEEEIAAAFFVSVAVVRQRLKLAAVSPRLLDVYAEDGMTLDQLIAFTVSDDHERQERVWEALPRSYTKEPYQIRRMLTENAVRASDKRARFVGIDAYVEAGGSIMRDLFHSDDGGWLQDVGLLELMVSEKLREEAAKVRAEGWEWIEVASSFPYGHTYGRRRLRGETVPLTGEEEVARAALQAEYDQLEASCEGPDEIPEAVHTRLGEIETALAAFDARPTRFEPDEITRAGAFVSIDLDGSLKVERGYVRREEEPPAAPEPGNEPKREGSEVSAVAAVDHERGVLPGPKPTPEIEGDDGLKPISDRLMTELTLHRTLALRQALGERPDVAFLAALHALTLQAFYHYGTESCLELELNSVDFGMQAPELNDSVSAQALTRRHQSWTASLPKDPGTLWAWLESSDMESRQALFAHVVALSINAVHETWNRGPRALAHADRLAAAVDLDMAAVGWRPTVENFLGRVTKARILQAVREACGEPQARLITHLKKGEMAEAAEGLLETSRWVPEPLRTPGSASRAEPKSEDEPDQAATKASDERSSLSWDDDPGKDEVVEEKLRALAAE